MSAKQYARLVPKKHRAQRTPVIDRPMRPRMIAWAGPSAFYPNRFYEIDKWYKGRIDKPEEIPKFYTIDPTNHLYSLADLLEREKPKHPDINIGFVPRSTLSVAVKSGEDREVLERKSRKMELRVDYESTTFSSTSVVRHYGVFEHLFGKGVFFENVQNLDVFFGDNGVFFGNTLSASLTSSKPQVRIESVKAGEYNTLIMLNLDGNPYEKEGEIVHWMVANISDGESIENGDEVVPYLQPLPFYGTGYHRVVFVLFRHESPLQRLPKLISDSLDGRVFLMSHFYKENEDTITPSFISFFQTSYDISVKNQLHGMAAVRSFANVSASLWLDVSCVGKVMKWNLFEAPKWLDPNYNENKKVLPAWQHRRILAREGRYKALYENVLKS
ncbi:hypothetical protein Angca_007551 [Angiostrongylus cantonensis]|nr:hypothetical protein Angca_007551 [Angiostrongylus cantonensis]